MAQCWEWRWGGCVRAHWRITSISCLEDVMHFSITDLRASWRQNTHTSFRSQRCPYDYFLFHLFDTSVLLAGWCDPLIFGREIFSPALPLTAPSRSYFLCWPKWWRKCWRPEAKTKPKAGLDLDEDESCLSHRRYKMIHNLPWEVSIWWCCTASYNGCYIWYIQTTNTTRTGFHSHTPERMRNEDTRKPYTVI